MNIIEIIAQDIFDKVRGRFTNLEMGNEDGGVTTDPKEARFFDFDFVIEGNNLGRVSISINERGTLKVFYSQGITEGTDVVTRGLWYEFLKEMRFFAKRRMMRFDTRDITKGNLNKDDYQYLAQNGSKETGNMNESSMYGSSKTSYRKLENTRLIVRHSKAIEEGKPGERARHINALFIENADGERFKYPFIHLAGAKAMQRHVANGGTPFDDHGHAIIKMSEQISQLSSFKRHVRTSQLNDDANLIHQRAGEKLQQLKDCVERLQGQNFYENWVESYAPAQEAIDLDPVTIEDYKNKFTVKQFDETLASVFPLLHSIMQEAGTIDLEELVHEGEEEKCDECGMLESKCECDEETNEGFGAFEEWADALAEGTMTPDQIAQFRELISSGLTLGPDGTSAIEALQGIGIEDPALEQALKGLAAVDPSADPLETIEAWLKVNDPDVLAQLGGGQEAPAPAEQPAPEAGAEAPEVGGEIPSTEPVAEETDEDEEDMDNAEPTHTESVTLKELAEFIGAFYNPHANEQGLGEWRKGATELGIMASKQFGDRAGKLVEKLVTQMQNAQAGDRQFAEVMKLAGIKVQQEGIKDVAKKVGGAVKAGAKAVGKAIVGKDDDELIRDLQKKVGAPQHGKRSMAKPNEGAEFDVIRKLAGLAK